MLKSRTYEICYKASQEGKARAAGEAEAAKTELQELKSQLEDPRFKQHEGELQRLTKRCQLVGTNCDKLSEQLELARSRAELDHYRKLETERRKWEEREQRLVEQLRKVQWQLDEYGRPVTVHVLQDLTSHTNLLSSGSGRSVTFDSTSAPSFRSKEGLMRLFLQLVLHPYLQHYLRISYH